MFGGLRHQDMKAKGRADWLDKDYGRSAFPVEGTQCICAAVNSVVEIMKFLTTNTLTEPTYLEMLKNSFCRKLQK
jgi:hypothetical protein